MFTFPVSHFSSAWWTPNWLLNNLVSYYKADTSWSFPDTHGSSNGTINGATYTASGKINWGYDFDGTNDYITVSHAYTWHFTIATWVKFDSFKTWESQIYRIASWSKNIWFSHTGTSGTNTFQLYSHDGTSGSSIILWFTPVVWEYYLLIAKWDGITRTFTAYRDDGTSTSGTSSIANSIVLSATAQIWRHPTASWRVVNGIIDEMGKWDTALTATQEEALTNWGAGLSYDDFTA